MKISIVVPVYNAEKFLKRCIESLINQTYEDDGSTDYSLEIIEKYKKIDKRIKLINQNNSGGVIARKNGIECATGEYCIIIDSDDWIELNTIELMVKKINDYNKPDIIRFRYMCEPSKVVQNKIIKTNNNVFFMDKKDVFDMLVTTYQFNSIWNTIIKRDLFDFKSFVYENIVRKGEDLQINLQLFLNANNFLITDDILYHYYNNPNGITNKMNVQKYIMNINDTMYINNLKIKIGNDLYSENFEKKVQERFIEFLVEITIRLLEIKKITKKDLEYIQSALEKKHVFEFIEEIDTESLKINFIKKIIAKNIKNKKITKLYKYRGIILLNKTKHKILNKINKRQIKQKL